LQKCRAFSIQFQALNHISEFIGFKVGFFALVVNGKQTESESPDSRVTLQPGQRLEVYYQEIQKSNGSKSEKFTAKVLNSDGTIAKSDVDAWDVDYIEVQKSQTFIDEGVFSDNRYNTKREDNNAKIPNPPTGEGTIKLKPGLLSYDSIMSKDDANKGTVTISGDSDSLKISTSGKLGYTPSVDFGEGKPKQ
jgi:hypothetical protein